MKSNYKIRHLYDEKNKKWLFSIVDIIENLTNTTDARNYWKVLKSRLKKRQNELVTQCNQLKMKSKDGKMYRTDVGDKETILEIIKQISPEKTEEFDQYFSNFLSTGKKTIEDKNEDDFVPKMGKVQLLVDAYQTESDIWIEAMIAGVSPSKLEISIKPKKIIIKGKREKTEKVPDENYFHQELLWTNFSRIIHLPRIIDTEKTEIEEHDGYLKIKLPIKIPLGLA